MLKTETAKDAQRPRFLQAGHAAPARSRGALDAAQAQFMTSPGSRPTVMRLKNFAVGVTRADASVEKVQLAALTNVATVVMNTPDAYSLR